MINSPKEAGFPLKQEGNYSSDHEKAKDNSSISSASQWTRLKDPRIVRVSRAFGGKDRHSKVCTIRGLRDRRVRLSVPTAIQLYDLQDRLGLNQPSKVVDWLLNAAKHEIDELPPLPDFPPAGNFPFSYPSAFITSNEANSNTSQPNQQLLNINRNIQWEGNSSQNSIWQSKPKEVSGEIVTDDKANYWMNRSEEEDDNKQGSNNEGPSAHHVLPHNNFLQRANHPSFLSLLNTMPLGNYQWQPSSDHVNSQLGNHGLITSQSDINVIRPLPSTLSLSTGNSQMLICPHPGATAQSYFPSQVTAMEMDQRQINHHYQMLSSSSSQNPLTNSLNNPSFSLAMMTSSNKDQDFTPK